MRVLMLSWEYPPVLVGGLARHVAALSRELATQGIRVDVLTRGTDGLPAYEEQDGLGIHRVQPYFGHPPDFPTWAMHLNFALCESGARHLRQLGAKDRIIVHAHDWLVAHAARFLKNTFRLPLVATVHATEHGRMNGIHTPTQQYINDVEWWLTYEAWRVVVCSESMRHEVENLFRLPDDKVAVIPNGIDLAPRTLSSGPPREQFAAPDEPLIFHIGRLVQEKGARTLIEAFALLPAGRLVIAGSGPEEQSLRDLVASLGITDRVTFTGFVDDATRVALFRHADVAVVPSLYEPFGIVALEAMVLGAPLVASAVGGLDEIVADGIDGLKVIPGSPSDLADKIGRLLADRPLAMRLAMAAKRKVEERYLWPRIAEQTASLYQQVLDHGDGTAGRLNTDRAAVTAPGAIPRQPRDQGRYTV